MRAKKICFGGSSQDINYFSSSLHPKRRANGKPRTRRRKKGKQEEEKSKPRIGGRKPLISIYYHLLQNITFLIHASKYIFSLNESQPNIGHGLVNSRARA